MANSYITKFSPNKKHIIAVLLLLTAVVFFGIGIFRAMRVSGQPDITELTSEPIAHENDSIIFAQKPFESCLNGASKESPVGIVSFSGGLTDSYEGYIVNIAGKYRTVIVKNNSEEFDKLMNGEKVTGYFTHKNSCDALPGHIDSVNSHYALETPFTKENCSDLGIMIVSRKTELLSFLWGMPFLIIGLIFLFLAGSPFFNFPESINENNPDTIT